MDLSHSETKIEMISSITNIQNYNDDGYIEEKYHLKIT